MRISTTITLLTSALFFSSPAFATFTVYGPGVTKGELELEAKSRFDFDDRASEDGYEKHLLEANYGVTDWWKAGIEAIWERDPEVITTILPPSLPVFFELTEPDEYWLHVGARLVYKINHEQGGADKIESFLLLQKKIDRFKFIANIRLDQEVGSNAKKDFVFGTAWKARYKVNSWFRPTLEYYNSFGELGNWQDYDQQTHRLGPVWYGHITDDVSFEAGYLFGLSKKTEDGSAKFKIEYKKQF